MDLPDLKRDDIARKSIRIPSNRLSKRLAPAPPARIESIPSPTSSTSSSSTFDSSPSRVERQINEINLRNTFGSPSSSVRLATPPSPVPSKSPSGVDLTDAPSEPFLKLSDIKKCSAISLDRNNQARMDFFTTKLRTAEPLAARPTTTVTPPAPSSIDMLNQLEKHIHQMELDSKANEIFAAKEPPPIKPMTKMTNRYGDHENLLNTGISNVASGTGLCYDGTDDDEDLEPRQFQRGTGQARNSTLGVSLSATPKVSKPIGRTVSDTKNVESVVKSIRLGLKKMDEDLKTTAANRAAAAAAAAKTKAPAANNYQPSTNNNGTLSPLTNKKKEDTIMVNSDRDRLPPHRPRPPVANAAAAATTATTSQAAAATTTTPTKRYVDRETLRHAITSPTASRLKDAASARNTQVTQTHTHLKTTIDLCFIRRHRELFRHHHHNCVITILSNELLNNTGWVHADNKKKPIT